MRRLIMTSIILAVAFLSGSFAISNAQAMTAPGPAGLASAIEQANPVYEIQYGCRRVRRCGPNGCYWRRVCGGYYGPGYYRGYGGGYYGGYYGNPCRLGWTVQDGVCKPYRGY